MLVLWSTEPSGSSLMTMKNPAGTAALLLGDRIRQARVRLGLSQEAIASLAAMHVTNFGKIERGGANPSLLTMMRIAAVLGNGRVHTDPGHLGRTPAERRSRPVGPGLSDRTRGEPRVVLIRNRPTL